MANYMTVHESEAIICPWSDFSMCVAILCPTIIISMAQVVCLVTVPLSHTCDTAVLTTATVMSPGDGIKVVDINKHCQLTEGITT